MINNLIAQSLRTVIGQYNYNLAPTRIGVASLDYEYIASFIFLVMTIWFIYRMFLSAMVKRR